MPTGGGGLDQAMPGVRALKEKRRALKPLLTRLQKEFNISVAEMDYQEHYEHALVACAHVSNDANHTHRTLQKVIRWVETHWGEGYIADESIEML